MITKSKTSTKAPETATVLTSQQEPVVLIGFTRPQGPVVIIIKTDITARAYSH